MCEINVHPVPFHQIDGEPKSCAPTVPVKIATGFVQVRPSVVCITIKLFLLATPRSRNARYIVPLSADIKRCVSELYALPAGFGTSGFVPGATHVTKSFDATTQGFSYVES